VRFESRKEFVYDPQIGAKKDTQTALKIYAEYVRKHSAVPAPSFFEVDRSDQKMDPLWHSPVESTALYSREIQLPAINTFERPDWRLTKLGIVPMRKDKFLTGHNILQQLDYFPQRGDKVGWNGYRYLITKVVIPPEAYWGQTGVWLGVEIQCTVMPEGDTKPFIDNQHVNLGEFSDSKKIRQGM
jgi:hypothetical protein